MNRTIVYSFLLTGALLSGGCATKKYVRQTVDPVSGRVDQVAQQTNKQGETLDSTRKDLERDETELSATKERAMTADSRATDALTKADQAGQKADQNGRDLGDLRQSVANLDDYKQKGVVAVPFGFNKDTLTADAKRQLDQLFADKNSLKRYFVAVEGFTDRVGSADYNSSLSRRRADRVMQYLVAKQDIPVYRIHMIGLGKEKPVDEGRSRSSNAKNRRVEVVIYTAESVSAMNQSPSSNPVNR